MQRKEKVEEEKRKALGITGKQRKIKWERKGKRKKKKTNGKRKSKQEEEKLREKKMKTIKKILRKNKGM